MRAALITLAVIAGLLTAPVPPTAAVPAGATSDAPPVRTYEVEPTAAVPAGCSTPAGKGASAVSSERGRGSARSLLIDDQSASSHTVVVCPLDPQPTTSLSFSVYPAALPNGFLFSLHGRWTGNTPGVLLHLNVTADGALHWYDGTRWTRLAAAGSVRLGQWSTIRVEAGQRAASVFVNDSQLGTAYPAGTGVIQDFTAYQLASNGTVPAGDRVFFDDLTTRAGRGYETEPVGAVPAGCVTPAGKASGVVSTARANTGARSLRLDDRATASQTVISCPAVPQRGIDLRLAAYPAALQNGFLVSLRGHMEGFADVRTVFHLAFVADGSVRWYDGAAWTTVTQPGVVPVGRWSQLQVRVAADQEAAQILVAGNVVATTGPIGMRKVVDLIGFDLSSNGTATLGDEVFFDDLLVGAADSSLPPGDVLVGPDVTVDQVSNDLLQMPHTSVAAGTEVLTSYANHVDTSAGIGTRLAVSADQGTSWRREDARNPMPGAQSYNLSRLRNGDLLTVSYHTYMVDGSGNRRADVESRVSKDNGKTWGPVRVGTMTTPVAMRPISPNSSRPGRTMGGFVLVHSVVEDQDGTMYLSAYGYYQPDQKYRQLVLRSVDGGLNWETRSTIAFNATQPGEGFCEAGLARTADGSLIAVMRTGWYLNMYVSRSTDNGLTWSTPTILRAGPHAVPVIGVYPSMVNLPDGRLVLYFGRPGQSLMVSPDGNGTSWTMPVPIDFRNSANGSIIPLSGTRLLALGDRGAEWSVNKPPSSRIWSRVVDLGPEHP